MLTKAGQRGSGPVVERIRTLLVYSCVKLKLNNAKALTVSVSVLLHETIKDN